MLEVVGSDYVRTARAEGAPRSASRSCGMHSGTRARPQRGDPYPVMAWLMVTAVMIIVFNLLADVAYGYLDARVRIE